MRYPAYQRYCEDCSTEDAHDRVTVLVLQSDYQQLLIYNRDLGIVIILPETETLTTKLSHCSASKRTLSRELKIADTTVS